VLLALDDAHRADRVSLRLVAHVGRRLAQLPALLVLTRREGAPNPELDGLLADLLGAGVPLRELTLGPVGDTEIAALAQSQTPLREPDLRAVVAAAEGNPLLAVETARSLAAGGVGPPPNLRTAVRATVGRLPRDTVEVVQLLAVAGRPLQRTELHRLAAPGTADAAARSEGLLVGSTGRLGFRHELLRAAVYADLVDPAELHERVAGALDPEELVEVGHHLAEAGRPREAAQRFAAAAARAREVGAVAEAVDLLTRAVELDPDDGRLWLELEETWAWTGRPTDMDAAWARVVRLLPAEELPAAWCRRGRQFRTVVCHPEEALRCYRTAQESAPAELDPSVRAEILVGLAWGDAVAGSGEEFEDLLAAVDDLPSDLGPQARADVLEIRMQGMIRQGRFREAADLVRPTSPDIGSDVPDRAYGVLVNAACALVAAGDDEAALAMIERAVAATGEIDVMAMQCLTARAHVLARLGRYDEAEAAAQQVQERADRLDSPALSAVAAHDHGLVALAAGRYDDAARLLGRALDEGAGVSRVAAGLMRAEALARSGNAAAAEAQLRAALTEPTGPADQPWTLVPRVAWVQALIAHARSDTDGVRRRLDEAERGWRAMGHRGVTGEDYLASIVDLGRPPVVGLVEPDRELARIEDLRSALEEEERCRAST
jgi:tetratricopeptide (TPR) repeat protein